GRHVFVSSTALGLAEGRHGAAKILRPNPPHLAHAQAGRLSDRFGAHVVFDSQPHALEATLLHRPGFLLERQFQLLDLFRARFLSGSHFTPTYITSSLNASLYEMNSIPYGEAVNFIPIVAGSESLNSSSML